MFLDIIRGPQSSSSKSILLSNRHSLYLCQTAPVTNKPSGTIGSRILLASFEVPVHQVLSSKHSCNCSDLSTLSCTFGRVRQQKVQPSLKSMRKPHEKMHPTAASKKVAIGLCPTQLLWLV
eukprot:symbB.v1.2.025855.t1/scaffold2539.1/size76650/3